MVQDLSTTGSPTLRQRAGYLAGQVRCDEGGGAGGVSGDAGARKVEGVGQPADHEAEPTAGHRLRRQSGARAHLHVDVLLVHAADVHACMELSHNEVAPWDNTIDYKLISKCHNAVLGVMDQERSCHLPSCRLGDVKESCC